jgi:hypothetical protein
MWSLLSWNSQKEDIVANTLLYYLEFGMEYAKGSMVKGHLLGNQWRARLKANMA